MDTLAQLKGIDLGNLKIFRWLKCDQKFTNMDDLVNHVNDYHVKVERPDVDYQCKWDGCPRKGKGFNAR
jgi:zinc finger protein GLIS2